MPEGVETETLIAIKSNGRYSCVPFVHPPSLIRLRSMRM